MALELVLTVQETNSRVAQMALQLGQMAEKAAVTPRETTGSTAGTQAQGRQLHFHLIRPKQQLAEVGGSRVVGSVVGG